MKKICVAKDDLNASARWFNVAASWFKWFILEEKKMQAMMMIDDELYWKDKIEDWLYKTNQKIESTWSLLVGTFVNLESYILMCVV